MKMFQTILHGLRTIREDTRIVKSLTRFFNHIIKHGIDNGFIDTTTVFGDGTHRKANANSRKATDRK